MAQDHNWQFDLDEYIKQGAVKVTNLKNRKLCMPLDLPAAIILERPSLEFMEM